MKVKSGYEIMRVSMLPHQRPALLGLVLFLVVGLAACSTSTEGSSSAKQPKVNTVGDGHFGAYIVNSPWRHSSVMENLELDMGHEFDMIQWFTSYEDPFESVPIDRTLDQGKMPIITWQMREMTLDDIIAGNADAKLSSWAWGIKNRDGLVYLRPFPEMNGDWVPWSGDPEKFITAWRYMVDFFAAQGADNVRWVWCPNITDWPRTEENRFENYYPGTEYVDVLALDGFNWGTVREWSVWQSFEDIFTVPYERITSLGGQPLWLTEIASAEEGGDKAEWVKEMLGSTKFPQIDGIVWFHERKEADWRINSSDNSLNAFREWFESQDQQ